jgi:hypothetical protein
MTCPVDVLKINACLPPTIRFSIKVVALVQLPMVVTTQFHQIILTGFTAFTPMFNMMKINIA